jgi:hypothetical protein
MVAAAVKRLPEAFRPPNKMKLVEPAGNAPASAGCKPAVLLLNEGPDDCGARAVRITVRPRSVVFCLLKKERSPLPRRLALHPQDFPADVSVF